MYLISLSLLYSVLPIIPYYVPIILNLFPSHHHLIILQNFSVSVHGYMVAEYICVNKIDIVRNTS